MSKPVVFMYSGQGSQYFQMGRELYEQHPRFSMWMDYCDELVEHYIGQSLIDILYDQSNSKSDPFDNICHTNPALLCIEYSLTRVLTEQGIKPDYLLGYSLGEFAAAVVSEAISLEQGLELLVEYGNMLKQKTPDSGMMAVITSPDITTQMPQLFDKVWIAGRNFDKHFVVSGLSKDIDALQAALKANNIMCQQLAVKYGFHTPLIEAVETDFKTAASGVQMNSVTIPTFSGLKAGLLDQVDENYLWQVTREPVEFERLVKAVLAKIGDATFIDVGPSGTLSTFVKYCLPKTSQSEVFEIVNQYGKNIRALDALKTKLLV